jgi:hypothetical protein
VYDRIGSIHDTGLTGTKRVIFTTITRTQNSRAEA